MTTEGGRKGGLKCAAGVAERQRLALSRPRHVRHLEPFSDEWFAACNRAFVKAMSENPDRPSANAMTYNGVGSSR